MAVQSPPRARARKATTWSRFLMPRPDPQLGQHRADVVKGREHGHLIQPDPAVTHLRRRVYLAKEARSGI